ncbi:MAG: Inner membrane protein translocase and chaperone YidC, short form OxaI-like [uncultured Nocardioidaceae bacterium]|uniref:Membrane protein insertase YidC n=1 Tax=uncultured Nocardioidaceae bacterium TaxID=253824 RepID=A0A6J4L7Y0_9ACTN|nr:MAG: Inner membrane protein translocase and chaperone YidC, short form OxaI-like [uncultured Nocardioidaceae bacterium]
MAPLYFITSVVLSGFHHLFGLVFGDDSGAAWALSIVGLTLVIRAALIPLFVRQIKSSRNMQLIQPRVRELQKKYSHDREKLAQETMALYKETGTNPFSSCLPLILQMPIFLALFRLLDQAAKGNRRGVLTTKQVESLSEAKIFGARIADTFTGAEGDTAGQVRILAALLVVAMTATTFLTQRQLMTKNMPPDALTGQYAQQQKLLLYVLPVVFAVGGIAFPIGVILYWTTSNLWTMGQQFYVIRNNPAPGTPAEAAKQRRVEEKARKKGGGTATVPSAEAAPSAPLTTEAPAPRQQPKKQSREQRKKSRPANPGSGSPRPSPGAK